MNTKKVIIIIVGLILFAIILWPRGDFKIKEVENGNTVVLDNGTIVTLIGVSDTEESKEFLDDNYLNAKVELLSDSSSPFDPNHLDGTETVYAYVIQTSSAQCINSTLIRTGVTNINETFLTDSLKAYRKYSERINKQ